MSQHTELIAMLREIENSWSQSDDVCKTAKEAADALQALERQKQPDDLEQIIDAFVEDYEMVGEDEDGRDACHTPTEGERALIKDAICGLLADRRTATHTPAALVALDCLFNSFSIKAAMLAEFGVFCRDNCAYKIG